ncbi:PTS transporter subunit IIC [Alkalihalobacillus sp. 1P02AB]|uniref:PTS transporter subunit IIC n=1 Tax=Alkalihalobacillus sp. 1P02AB TaxID=3132260 RepID=UPI0039A61C6C
MKQSTKEYIVDRMYKASAGLANAVLVTLGIGLLIESIGIFTGLSALVTIGKTAQLMLAPAFGAGIAYQLGGNTLVIFSAMAASTIGANALQFTEAGAILVTGQPLSAVLAALIAIWVGKRIAGKTQLDMLAIPLSGIVAGGLAGYFLALVTTPLIELVSAFIASSVQGSPLLGPIVISLVWSMFLMSPASSAAIAISLQLDPVSSAAALIGCTVQFVGFTVMSYRQNELGANLAQGLLTPKVQFPNVVKNPRVLIPPFISAIICAPIATLLFNLEAPYEVAGLGLNSFIAPLNILANQGVNPFFVYVGIGILLPAVITIVIYRVLKGIGWIKAGDLHLKVQ